MLIDWARICVLKKDEKGNNSARLMRSGLHFIIQVLRALINIHRERTADMGNIYCG